MAAVVRFLVLTAVLLALAPTAQAAGKRKPQKAKPAEASEAPAAEAEPTPPPAPPPAVDDNPNRPRPFGSGYSSWGTRAGATLGSGNGARAGFFVTNHTFGDGYGYGGLEAVYLLSIEPSLDIGFGARVPFWHIGIAPGAEVRWRMTSGASRVQLALTAAANVPLTFLGLFGGFGVGLYASPGVALSIFLRDNMELYFAFAVPVSPLFLPTLVFQIGFEVTAGWAYTLKKSNVGFYGEFLAAPGLYAFGGNPTIFSNVFNPVIGPTFGAGLGFRTGVSYRY